MKVLLTGGTGSLGRALVEYFLDENDEITVYSRDEVKQSELRRDYPDVRYMLGDVRDSDRLALAMRGQQVVIHAAAYKQVPSAEANVDEAIATNVMGSLNVARAAVHANVDNVIGVSTDKACAPVNAYGQTKALMEKLFQQADGWSDTGFNCVRYGNVLGSRGSVVPLFAQQIRSGKKLTLTDPAMTRFWMTMDQAVQVVTAPLDLQFERGSIIVPKCKASTMFAMVAACNNVFSRNPGATLDYEVIGTRPGEKMHEQLVHPNEGLHTLDLGEVVEGEEYFELLPATHAYHDGKIEYNSATAPQLSVVELECLVSNCA